MMLAKFRKTTLLLTRSSKMNISSESYRVQPMKQLSDNYSYIVIDNATNECAVVDVSEFSPVLQEIKNLNAKCTTILTTHHHSDHSGGNIDMKNQLGDIEIVGGDDRIPGLSRKVGHGDILKLGKLQIKCHFTPCHTSGHILYEVIGNAQNALFSGDTLFIAGCGKFFEGTASQMNYALNTVVRDLPDNTHVWCGHEYTLSNLTFSLTVDPNNIELQNKYEWARHKRENDLPTIPSTVAEEKSYNPFMRVSDPVIKNQLELSKILMMKQ